MFRRLSPGLMELIPRGYSTVGLRMALVGTAHGEAPVRIPAPPPHPAGLLCVLL